MKPSEKPQCQDLKTFNQKSSCRLCRWSRSEGSCLLSLFGSGMEGTAKAGAGEGGASSNSLPETKDWAKRKR